MIVGQNVIYYYVGRRKQCRATQSVPANAVSYRVGSTISLGARCSFPFPYTMSATPIRGGTLISQYATSTWLKSRACLGGSGFMSFWHKDDYCCVHDRFHMRALYVGKGMIEQRLLQHWKDKDFSEEMLVYWTSLEMPNRQAKYVEQLLLDLYKFPHNKSENKGRGLLCAHFEQVEVD